MRNKRNGIIAAIISTTVLVAGIVWMMSDIGLDAGRPLTTLSPKGPKAQNIQDLIIPVFLIAGIVFVFVQVAIVWMAARFRRRPEDVDGVDEPTQTHGNTALEIGWTVLPAVVLAILAVFNVQVILDMNSAEDPLDVTVIGHQWWWEYRYDLDGDGVVDIITANEGVIPAGRDIRMNIQSRDVIHSFWIPALAGKLDAIPGRTHELVINADEPGLFEGQCTEFCGLSHGVMRMQVKALDSGDYEEWVELMTTAPAEPETEIEIAGRDLFVTQCSSCHQINGITPSAEQPFTYSDLPDGNYDRTLEAEGAPIPLASRNAPNLTHMMMRQHFVGGLLDLYIDEDPEAADEPYVRPWENAEPHINNIKRWLRDTDKVKPMNPENNQGMPNYNLTEEQIDQLTAYFLTLKPAEPAS